MKLLIIFFSFFIINQESFAQKALSQQAFQVNVRPVLSGILSDFYQMISLFPEFPKDLSTLVNKVEEMEETKFNLIEKCPRLVNAGCLNVMLILKNKLSELQALTMEHISHQRMSTSLQMINISGIRLINQFQADLEQIKGEIDNSSLMLKAGVGHRLESHFIVKKLDELSTTISLSIVEFIPYTYKDEFRQFYFNFINPVQHHLSQNRNYEFLNRNVNALNFSLNLLNQNLTKRNKKTPEGMGPYLNLIHNRWNSLLRYYF